MKYLKLFESVKLYEQISYVTFTEKIERRGDVLEYTDSEENLIRSEISNHINDSEITFMSSDGATSEENVMIVHIPHYINNTSSISK